MQNEAPMWVSFVPYVMLAALFAIPTAQILRRVGRSPWWALTLLFPIAILPMIWVLAFIRWPAFEPKYYEGVFDDAPDNSKPGDPAFLKRG